MGGKSIGKILQDELADWTCGWSVGSFGAIGEFHQADGEALIVDDAAGLKRATSRGGLQLGVHASAVPVAYELLSPKPHRWSQGIALCLPRELAMREARDVLTELGPDTDAVRPQDRQAILFDVGLAQPQIDFCIRTTDESLIAKLRSCLGKPAFATEAGGAIMTAHPHRVVVSNLGRAEVYQKIGGPETDGKSPEGPHTHVLPKLLAAKRTHSANTPIPDHLIPCAFLYPGNPVITALGDDKPLDPNLYERFQGYLRAYGRQEYVAVKDAVWAALDRGDDAATFREPDSRLERAGLRNALRQRARLAEANSDAASVALIAKWRAQFDKGEDGDVDDPSE